MPEIVTCDLYGNVFLNGENTNSQIGDFSRNYPELAPQVDGAIRQLLLDARAKIDAEIKAAQDAAAAQVAVAKAKIAELEATLKLPPEAR